MLSTGFFSVTTTNELLATSVVACQAIVVQTRWGVDGMVSMGMANLRSGWHLCWGAGEEDMIWMFGVGGIAMLAVGCGDGRETKKK